LINLAHSLLIFVGKAALDQILMRFFFSIPCWITS